MADESHEQGQTPADEGKRAIFRVPPTSLLTVLILLFCITPAAFAAPGLQVLYLIPIGVIVWVVRFRTTATREGLTVRTILHTQTLRWNEIKGLAITPKSKVRAVLPDDTQVALPCVRTRHVPVLSLVSEGLVADPSGVLNGSADENADENAEEGADSAEEDDATEAPAEESGSKEPAEGKA
ncbi:PH domain-containing protein [Prauserella cavernicola]|uniref:PH domain-containing protein n=1 Tax=Prauserella cavernicola TaxID=2800127 RepID=UPI0027DE28AD|nr:PH domain-containing protein [Prauserella cavernicola]